MEDTFIAPYIYEVRLDTDSIKWDGKYYIYTIDGKPSVSDNPHIRFYSKKQLTIKEVADRFVNTAGIIAIKGQFKDELSSEERELMQSINGK